MQNKDFLTAQVCKDTDLPRVEVKKVIDSLFENLAFTLAEGNSVSVRGVGTFRVVTRKAKKARNLHTGEEMMMPEKRVVKFKSAIDVL